MKNIWFIILCFPLVISCINKNKILVTESDDLITSTYYFIRHAEKDRSDSLNDNPHLIEIGKQRAEHWNEIFKNIKFDAVYSTNFNRTKETATPTAIKNKLELTIYDPKTMDIPSFLNNTRGKTILVVGHSNTIPNFVNKILENDTYNQIDDDNNGNLYIVTINGNDISSSLLSID
tara:strand:- start:13784 stop:14311 length:528 start_codon:yes stop_codon:yes gene_type:complete